MGSSLIFWPVIVTAIITMLIYIPMSRARVQAVKTGKAQGRDFKLNQSEPEESAQWVNAIKNQYETPVLFYTVCLSAYVTGTADFLMIILAFAFAALKAAHLYVHVTSNNLRLRRPVFALGLLVLLLMWLWFALRLLMA